VTAAASKEGDKTLKHLSSGEMADIGRLGPHFTHFTSTKVQILTQEAEVERAYAARSPGALSAQQQWALTELKKLGLWGNHYKIVLHTHPPPAAAVVPAGGGVAAAAAAGVGQEGVGERKGGDEDAGAAGGGDATATGEAAAAPGGASGGKEDYHSFVKRVEVGGLPAGWQAALDERKGLCVPDGS
jgi:hypothetical protein